MTADATTTYGDAAMKNSTKLIPAALPTMMLGTELIRVSKPPTLVKNASTRRKPSSFSDISSRRRETPVSEPTMIIAVTLLSTAENSTVIDP